VASTNNNLGKALGLILGLGTLTGNSHASDAATLSLGEQDFFAELPVILTATRLPQPVADVPAAVTVIDRQMIEAAGVEDIPSLFRLVAGFQVAHDRESRVSVTYHGASDQFARRMQVLVDGRSIYTPITGGVDWVDLPVALEDIARIEVTRGPNGVTYGANSFLGVINIITFHPADVRGFTFKSTVGDDDSAKGTLRYAGNSGALDYRITVEHREDNGFNDLNWDGNTTREANDGQRTTALTLRGDYRATVNDYLTFHAGLSEGPRERGYGPSEDDPLRWQQSQGNFQQVHWKRIRSSSEEFNITYYRNYQEHADAFAVGPLMVNNDIEAERHNLEFDHVFAPSAEWRLLWGVEARRDRIRAPGYLGSAHTMDLHLYRLFANGEWTPTESWTANFGAMLEHDEFHGSRTSPRLALNYKLDGSRYLRAAYTEAYRTPAAFEERADYAVRLADGTPVMQAFFSHGDLEPEHMTSYELAFGAHAMGSRTSYEMKLFEENIRDVIAVYRDNKVYYFTNDGETTIRGFEVQARLQPTEKSLISIAYSHAKASGYVLDRMSPTRYLDVADATPENTLSLVLANTFPGNWRGSLGLYHVTDITWLGADRTHYTTADFTLRKQLRVNGAAAEMTFTARDFLGAYFDYTNDTFLERRYYFGLALRLP